MDTYSQEIFDELISCHKIISDPPRKEMRLDRGNLRNDMRLKSLDGVEDFSVFIRQNESFPENFSIGLDYHPKDGRGSIILLRCNGQHGHFEDCAGNISYHDYFHIHRAREENISSGVRPERGAEITTEYANLDQAIQYFFRVINTPTADQYFPKYKQARINVEEIE